MKMRNATRKLDIALRNAKAYWLFVDTLLLLKTAVPFYVVYLGRCYSQSTMEATDFMTQESEQRV